MLVQGEQVECKKYTTYPKYPKHTKDNKNLK